MIKTEPTKRQIQHIACLHWLCRYDIPTLVPLDGVTGYAELATAARVPVKTLKSVVRMAICDGFLSEQTPNAIGHSRLSAQFARNAALRDWAMFLADASAPMALKLTDATDKWGETTSKTETAFNIAMNSEVPFFDYLSQSKELTKRFAGYMKCVTATQGTAIDHLLEGFDWAGLGEAKVVDVSPSCVCKSLHAVKASRGVHF